MDRGGNIKLSPIEVEQAIREHVIRLERARGREIKLDALDFNNNATVHFIGADNEPKTLASAFSATVVAWKE